MSAQGTISYSAERSCSDRYTCWLTKTGNPSARAMPSAFMTCQPAKFEHPT